MRPAHMPDAKVIPLPVAPTYPVTAEQLEDEARLPEGAGCAIAAVLGALIWAVMICGVWYLVVR